MDIQSKSQTWDPLHAPVWRKLLAVRVLILCLVLLAPSVFLVNFLDTHKQNVPQWLEIGLGIGAILPCWSLALVLVKGVPDLVVHFVPEGSLKRMLLWGDRSSEDIARDFGENGYSSALFPIYLFAAFALITIFILFIIGEVSLVINLLGLIFHGWPSWAILITILLILLLFKK